MLNLFRWKEVVLKEIIFNRKELLISLINTLVTSNPFYKFKNKFHKKATAKTLSLKPKITKKMKIYLIWLIKEVILRIHLEAFLQNGIRNSHKVSENLFLWKLFLKNKNKSKICVEMKFQIKTKLKIIWKELFMIILKP